MKVSLAIAVLLLIFMVRTLGVVAGLRFVGIQAVAVPMMVIGWVILAPVCATRWYQQNTDGKFHFNRMLWIFDNDEDGVMPHWYNPTASAWRAYLWSAWRNSVNNLRFLCEWKGGPLYRIEKSGWYYQHGFRTDTGWPVWSAGKL